MISNSDSTQPLGAYAYPTDPDAIQQELEEYLANWWLTAMVGVSVRVDGVSQEEPYER